MHQSTTPSLSQAVDQDGHQLWRRLLTRSHKRTSMGPSRSCLNGITSALPPEEITSKGTRVSCLLSIKVPIRKKSGNIFNDPRKWMDQRTRKLMTMQKALHPREDVDRLYVSRKEGGRRLVSIEDSVDASIQRLEDSIEKRGERLITATRKNPDNTRTNRTAMTKNKNGKKNNPMAVLNDK